MSIRRHRPGTNPPLWPQVTSPRARELVQSAFELSPLPHVSRPEDDASSLIEFLPVKRCDGKVMSGEDYQVWLKERMAGSSLALQLPGGIDALPDITPHLPWFLRSLFRMTRPRSIPGLVRHVVNFLDWYASPQEGARLRLGLSWVDSTMNIISGAAFLFAIFGLLLTFGSGLMESIAICIACLLLLGLLFAVATVYTPIDRNKFTINASEFYYFVKDAYADRPQPAPDDVLPDIFKGW